MCRWARCLLAESDVRGWGCIELTALPRDLAQIKFNEKVMWTVISLFIFLVCCQIPLYGVNTSANGADPFYWCVSTCASVGILCCEAGTPDDCLLTLPRPLAGCVSSSRRTEAP